LPDTRRKNPFKDESSALIAIPASMILFDDKKFVYLLFKPFAILKIIIVVIMAKMNETGVNKAIVNGKGSIKSIIAPNPAPADIPSSPGSARLFLKRDCKIIPAQESEAPTAIAFNMRGSLISKRIFLLISFAGELMLNNTSGEMKLLPDNNDIITETMSAIKSIINIESFRDKSIISFIIFYVI
jgi:hypothetical protein